jgi:hypothetical protein
MKVYITGRGRMLCDCGKEYDIESRTELPDKESRIEFPGLAELGKRVKYLEKKEKSNRRFKRWVGDKLANPKNGAIAVKILEWCDYCDSRFNLRRENIIAQLDSDRRFVKFVVVCPSCMEKLDNDEEV